MSEATGTAATYRVVVSGNGGSPRDGRPIHADSDEAAIEQARDTATGMPGGMSFTVLRPDGTVLREYSR